jgi:glycosyltransferase involved in cell wall biosynthesis
MERVVAVILTLNEEDQIASCIDSVRWCDDVVLWDSYSSDRTCEIARQMGAKVMQHPFRGYGSQRQAAMDAVDSDWILFVDADERIPPELATEIRQSVSAYPEVVGWWIPRHNYILGKLTLHAGWYPDYQLRLLRPAHARWDPEREVHELALLDGPDGYLAQPIIHYNYDTIAQFLRKQNRYTTMDAEILRGQGVRPKLWSPVTAAFRHFRWRYIDLEGYRDGLHGLMLCLLMSYYEAQKYVRLARLLKGDPLRS